MMVSTSLGLAVSPLTTDDADTVESRRLQLNAGWQFSHTTPVSSHALPINPVYGLHSRGELGATFGYQWRDGFGTALANADADGITDLTLATQWRLWQTKDDNFKLSAPRKRTVLAPARPTWEVCSS
jgi:hypothetical protein